MSIYVMRLAYRGKHSRYYVAMVTRNVNKHTEQASLNNNLGVSNTMALRIEK